MWGKLYTESREKNSERTVNTQKESEIDYQTKEDIAKFDQQSVWVNIRIGILSRVMLKYI